MPADSLAKARTPEPLSKGGRNWVTKLKPGNRGELPAYIQHIRNAIMGRGVPEDRATAIAVSAPKRWLHSRHSDKGTKAASALATGEWEKDRAKSRLAHAARRVATQASDTLLGPSTLDTMAVYEAERDALDAIEEAIGQPVLEAALSRVRWVEEMPLSPREHMLDELAERAAIALTICEATRSREPGTGRFAGYLKKVTNAPGAGNCPKCGALKLPDKMCPSCEAPMAGHKASLAEACVLVMQERTIHQSKRKELLAKGQALKNADGSISYPIENVDDLKSAAVLAKSGHGDVPRAKALIAKMSKKFGVKNPMQEADGEKRIAAPFHVEHQGKKLHATATASGWTPNAATRAHLGSLDKTTRSRLEHRMKRAGEAAHAAAAGKLGEAESMLSEMRGDRVHAPKSIVAGVISRKGTVGDKRAKKEGLDGGFEGYVHSVKDGSGKEHIIGSTMHVTGMGSMQNMGLWKARTPKGKMMSFARHGDAVKALHDTHKGKGPLQLREADEWAHLPAHKRPNATALEAARRISPHKGQADMVAKDRRAFGKALTGVKLTSDEHAAARAHAIRTSQLDALKKARRGGITESERHALVEADIDGAKPMGHGDALGRAKRMGLGETVRLPDGIGITHAATPDGRKVWRADTPSRYSSTGWSLGDEHREPEGAVKDAFDKSARSSDPASLGGTTRYSSHITRVSVGGKTHRFVGVNPESAKPEVRDITGTMQPGSVKTVAWGELHPVDDIMQQDEGVMSSVLDNRIQEADRARRHTINAIAGASGPKDTFDFHAKGGKFDKGRANIHGQMIRRVLDNPKAHEGGGDVAMVATRSPGGGNVHTVKGKGASIPHDAVHISIPAMRESLPEHAALDAHPSADAKAGTDREARHVAKVAATMALQRGRSAVIHDDKAPA